MPKNFHRKILKNGMIVLCEKRDLPLVAASVTNPYGGGYDSTEMKGAAHFIEHLLFTGTKTRTSEQISKEIEKKGGILNGGTYNEMTNYWFKLPSHHIFSGLNILADMVKNPTFNKEKFEKEKRVILEEIKMDHDLPTRHIWKMIEENLYGRPFGDSNLGTPETLGKMDRETIVKHFKSAYSPENYIVTLVGDVDFNQVCKYLEKNFRAEGKKIKIPEIKKLNKETIEEREGLDQAHLVFAIHAPQPNTSDYVALSLLDAYLADGMSSKLFIEIREKRGLAYSIQSALDPERNSPYYGIYVGTTKQNLPKVKELILETFDKVEKMTPQDLEEAKQRVIGLKDVSAEDSVNVMLELTFAELNGNAEDYYKYEEKIKKITLAQVKSVAKQLIQTYSTAAIVPK